MKKITVDTKLTGLFGHPLKQSFSPEMHNTNFEIQGYDSYYIPFEVKNDGLEEISSWFLETTYQVNSSP